MLEIPLSVLDTLTRSSRIGNSFPSSEIYWLFLSINKRQSKGCTVHLHTLQISSHYFTALQNIQIIGQGLTNQYVDSNSRTRHINRKIVPHWGP